MKTTRKLFASTLLAAFCFMATPAPAQAWFQYTPDWEYLNRDNFYNMYAQKAGINPVQGAQDSLQKRGQHIAAVLGAEDAEDYRFVWTQESQFNAYAVPGHNVFVSPKVKVTSSELNFILGHEITHSKDFHMLKSIDSSAETKFYGNLLLDLFTSKKPLSEQQQYAFAFNLLQTQYLKKGLGRSHENAADLGGWNALVKMNETSDKEIKGGTNVGGAAACFARFKIMYGKGETGGLLGVVSSLVQPDEHASNEERYNVAMTRLKEYSGGRVEVRNDNQLFVDGKLLRIVEEHTYGKSTYAPAEVEACLQAGILAKRAHNGTLPARQEEMLMLLNPQ